MNTLNSEYYRSMTSEAVTRENVDTLLDKQLLQCHMRNGNWWSMRRNGETKRWKKDATRIRIPFKVGLRVYGSITETDFV